MDDGYFSRIAAMDFAMRHDDGQFADELDEADVVLVGVSRTSKTPTCVYLANRGIRAANVPIVPNMPQIAVPRAAEAAAGGRPDHQPGRAGTYPAEPAEACWASAMATTAASAATMPICDRVREELVLARRLFARNDWPEIDVTKRSVEETAATIYQRLQAGSSRSWVPPAATCSRRIGSEHGA